MSDSNTQMGRDLSSVVETFHTLFAGLDTSGCLNVFGMAVNLLRHPALRLHWIPGEGPGRIPCRIPPAFPSRILRTRGHSRFFWTFGRKTVMLISVLSSAG